MTGLHLKVIQKKAYSKVPRI